jgi:DNA-binding transcriptional regulator WhiA
MKKYLLLIEDEKLWKKFKEVINKNINTEIMNLIKGKVGVKIDDGN